MSKIHNGLEQATFEVPEGVVIKKVCKYTGKLATSRCWSTYEEVFSEDNLPEECKGHYRRSTSTNSSGSTQSTGQSQSNLPSITVTDERTGQSTIVHIDN